MNQGFAVARGDYIGFLNSDDYYADGNVIRNVLSAFTLACADIVFGDIQIVEESGRVLRCWSSGRFKGASLSRRHLPHRTFFVGREVLGLGGPLDPTYKHAAGYKQQLILIERLKLRPSYIEEPLAVMREGRASTRSLKAIGNLMLLSDIPVHRDQAPQSRFFGLDDAVALADDIDASPVRTHNELVQSASTAAVRNAGRQMDVASALSEAVNTVSQTRERRAP